MESSRGNKELRTPKGEEMQTQTTASHSTEGSRMKITLEFNLPEEQQEFMETVKAQSAFSALREIEQMLRNHRKHDAKIDLDDIGALIGETLNQVEA
jgi:hypothetical protein